jgi:hypothetical protein
MRGAKGRVYQVFWRWLGRCRDRFILSIGAAKTKAFSVGSPSDTSSKIQFGRLGFIANRVLARTLWLVAIEVTVTQGRKESFETV